MLVVLDDQRDGHAVGVRSRADRRGGAGIGCVEIARLFQALIECVLRAGQEAGKLGAVLPCRAVHAVLTAVHRVQHDAVLGGACRRGRCGRGLCALGDGKRPALAVQHACGSGVLIALGNRRADIVGADIDGRCLGAAAFVAVILYRDVAHARYAVLGGNGRCLGAAAVCKVRRRCISQVGCCRGFLRDNQRDGHRPTGIVLGDRGRVFRIGRDGDHAQHHAERQDQR